MAAAFLTCCRPTKSTLTRSSTLQGLQDNGGPTQTIALIAGSPALDKGRQFDGNPTDQRGQSRPFDNPSIPNATGGDGTDIGAYEADADPIQGALIVNTLADHNDGVCGPTDCTLREAIQRANAQSGANTITFLANSTALFHSRPAM